MSISVKEIERLFRAARRDLANAEVRVVKEKYGSIEQQKEGSIHEWHECVAECDVWKARLFAAHNEAFTNSIVFLVDRLEKMLGEEDG
jgi:hypothetical protein